MTGRKRNNNKDDRTKGVVSRWLKLPKRMMLMKQKQRIEHLEQSLKAAIFESGGPES